MTYCFFSAQYLPSFGGVERYTFNLARELIARGEKSIVVTSERPGLSSHEIDSYGIEVFRVPSQLLMGGRFPVANGGPALNHFLDDILARCDRAVIQTRFYPLSYFAVNRCHKAKIPFIVIDHGAGQLNLGNPIANQCGEWYEHAITANLKKKVPAFYAVSHAGCDWLRHFKIESRGVLYNFIDPRIIKSATDGVDPLKTRQKYGLPKDRPIILFTGRLVEEKGVLPLAKAVSLLQKEKSPPIAVFAGSGPSEEALQKEGEFVHLLGTLEQKEVFALLKTSEIFCLPSRSEGMSTSVLEAAACGCYVITTDRGGSKELISSPQYGTILENTEPETIAGTIRNLLLFPEKRETAAAAAKEKVLHGFTYASTCTALMEIPWESL